jgi:hypothetical protein
MASEIARFPIDEQPFFPEPDPILALFQEVATMVSSEIVTFTTDECHGYP